MPPSPRPVHSPTMTMTSSITRTFFGTIARVNQRTTRSLSRSRKHGRYMTKNGYIDSSRRIRSLHRQQDDMLVLATHPARGGLLAPINKSSLSSSPATAKKSKPIAESPSAIAISANLESKKKEHEKHMRLIEVRSLPSRSLSVP